ncbi:MAG: hypothetical protein ACI8Z1_003570 [Candidatus Azotimanducaceae bacterium]|jgi:hypothetical protein
MTAKMTTHQSLVVRHTPKWQSFEARAGKHPRSVLERVDTETYLLVGAPVTCGRTHNPVNPRVVLL